MPTIPETQIDEVLEESPQSVSGYAVKRIQAMIAGRELAPGELLPAERKLAEELNISRTPLRHALQELERLRVIRRKTPRGYVVAAASSGQTVMSKTIVLVTRLSRKRWDEFHCATADRIEASVGEAVERDGLNLLQMPIANLDAAGTAWLQSCGLGGAIAAHEVAEKSEGKAILRQLCKAKIPVVAHGDSPELQDCDRVVCDQEAGMHALTRWLIGKGHRRILRLWTTRHDSYWIQIRNRGYERAVGEAEAEQVPPADWGIVPHGDLGETELCEAQAHWYAAHLAEHLLGGKKIDALVAVSDEHLSAIARACEMLGRDPCKDLCICGFDNFWRQAAGCNGKTFAPAATVEVHRQRVGRGLVELLRQRIAGQLPNAPQRILIPPDLVVNESGWVEADAQREQIAGEGA